MQSKICKVCHVKQPLTNFSKDSQLKSGLSNRCKTCDKIKNGKRSYRKRQSVLGWQEVTKRLSPSPEEQFKDLYGNADVEHKGKLVMEKGKILDEKWYQRKLLYIKKHT